MSDADHTADRMVAHVATQNRWRNRVIIALAVAAIAGIAAAMTAFIVLRVDGVLGEVRRNTAATGRVADGTQRQLTAAQTQLAEAQAQISAAQDQLAVLQRSLDAAVSTEDATSRRIADLTSQLSAAQTREAQLTALVTSEYQQLLARPSTVVMVPSAPPSTVKPGAPTTTTVPRPPVTVPPCGALLHEIGLC